MPIRRPSPPSKTLQAIDPKGATLVQCVGWRPATGGTGLDTMFGPIISFTGEASMKTTALVSLVTASSVFVPAGAVELWHSSTVWAGQGQCSAVFSFDSAGDRIETLQVSVSALNHAGEKLASGVLEVHEFGGSSANRYTDAFLESEAVCDDDLTIVVTGATGVVNGKRIDLLKTGALTAREFKPFRIRVGR